MLFRFGEIAKIEGFGAEGVIVALLSLDPTPVYLLELPSGKSIKSVQSSLVSTGKHSGRRLIIRRYDGS